MTSIYGFVKSTKVAVVLLIVIVVLSVIATLVPQGQEEAYYLAEFQPSTARLILSLQLDRFFSSVIFSITLAVFTLNLAACTLDRMVTRLRRRARKRFGPDLIHFGLLVLIVGGIVTLRGRQEATAYLGEGDVMSLSGGYELVVEAYEYFAYDTGRPKDWVTTVSVDREAKRVVEGFRIEVNRPLRVGDLKVYQASYGQEAIAVLVDESGDRKVIRSGEGLEWEKGLLILAGVQGAEEIDGNVAVFENWYQHERTGIYRAGAGGGIGEYVLESLSIRDVTGLNVVRDPGYVPVVIALIMVTLGFALTITQKIGDRQI